MARHVVDTLQSFKRPERMAAILGPDPGGLYGDALRRSNYAVYLPPTGPALLQRCAREHCEILVLTGTIEDAVDDCRMLRASPHGAGTFVIAVVGEQTPPADLDALLTAGANDFVVGDATPAAIDVRLRIADAWLTQRGSRRRAESQSRLDGAKLRAVFEGTYDGLLLLDDDGRIADCNAAAATLFGRDRKMLTGAMLMDAIGKKSKLAHQSAPEGSEVAVAWRRMLQRGEQTGAFQLALIDGTKRDIEYVGRASILPGLHLLVVRDVTEQRRVRDQLIVADRLASLGAVASGIGHEINNPLATLVANTEYLQLVLQKPILPDAADELRIVMEDTVAAVDRLRAISNDLRSFAHLESDSPRRLDVSGVVDTAIRIAAHQVQRKARLVRDFDDVPRVNVVEGKLGHVMLHLLLLAASTIPAGAQQTNEIKVTVRLVDGKVTIEVRDTGAGIPSDAVPRVLDALTQRPSAHSGPRSGLFVVKSIVESLGGEISIEAPSAGGTSYRVTFPQAA